MPELPSGTVTFLFTDIAGSTRLWEADRAAMAHAVDRQLAILRDAVAAHRGVLFKTVGDGTQSAFPTAPAALAAALAAQRVLSAETWPDPPGSPRVRMALHAGEAQPRDGDYLAAPLNRLARLLAAGHGGQILLSATVADLAQDALPPGSELRDLGAHRLRDLYRPEQIFQLLAPGLPAAFPPLITLEQRPNNLPLQPTLFLGREREIARIIDLLRREETRLITLTGPGGVGKTRLALQAAADMLDEFENGVFFVELGPLADPALVPAAIAQVLGVRAEGGQPLLDVLTAYVRSKAMLLVLDNFEHLLDAAPVVSGLSRDAPGVKILATSRAPLRLRGEREVPVLPMQVPDPRRPEPLERLSQYEAVRLFIARAQDARPDFTVTNETAPAVAEICSRLDGLPLAIELAAARVKLLSPPALLARLERRLPLLTGGARDAPLRQQTLRDTIAWSYDLLSAPEQTLFHRLTVFAGGIALAAAEEIVNPAGGLDVFSSLAALVDESLLRETADILGEPRFTMLETIREFGFDALTASGEAAEMRDRHAAWFLGLAEEGEQALRGAKQIQWLDSLEAERDNLRAAFSWAMEHADLDTALRLANSLGSFWMVRGTVNEGSRWLDQALARAAATPGPLYAQARLERAWMATVQLDFDTAERLAARALDDSHEFALPEIEAQALAQLAHLAAFPGDLDRAASLAERAAAIYQVIGLDKAHPGDRTLWARIEHRRGNFDLARTRFEETLTYFRTVAGDLHWIAEVLDNLGDLDCDQGHYQAAAANYAEALANWQALGDIWGTADALTGFAQLAEGVGQPEVGARLLGAADALYEQAGIALPPHDRINYPKTVAAIQRQLGAEAFASANGAGRSLTMEQAVAEAMALADRVANATDGSIAKTQQTGAVEENG